MIRIIIWLVLFIAFVETSELIERENGYFITGAGCGGDTPISYLNYIPEDLEQNQCTFINMDDFVPSYLRDVESKIGLFC